MTEDEYEELKRLMESRHNEEKKSLDKTFAFANNTYKVDDIIQDSNCIIKIDKIKFACKNMYFKFPECFYMGRRLRKDLTPYKNGDYETIYNSSIIRKIEQ